MQRLHASAFISNTRADADHGIALDLAGRRGRAWAIPAHAFLVRPRVCGRRRPLIGRSARLPRRVLRRMRPSAGLAPRFGCRSGAPARLVSGAVVGHLSATAKWRRRILDFPPILVAFSVYEPGGRMTTASTVYHYCGAESFSASCAMAAFGSPTREKPMTGGSLNGSKTSPSNTSQNRRLRETRC